MSTPSRIIIKLRKEDIGRKIKFDPNKLPLPLGNWIYKNQNGRVWRDERDKEKSREITLKGEYIGIYCHWDGYIEGVGEVLKNCFNDYETALNLIAGGWLSGICSGEVNHYANRMGWKWSDIKPLQGSLNYLRENIYGQHEYIFDDNWFTKRDKEFVPLFMSGLLNLC